MACMLADYLSKLDILPAQYCQHVAKEHKENAELKRAMLCMA